MAKKKGSKGLFLDNYKSRKSATVNAEHINRGGKWKARVVKGTHPTWKWEILIKRK